MDLELEELEELSCGDGQERGDKEGERGETLLETFSVVNVLT